MNQVIRNTIILSCLLFAFNSSFAQQSRIETLIDNFKNHPEYILVTAHRGAHQKYPENSLAAIKEAIRLQADIVEFDVRETKDHQLVIVHDESIDRVSNGKGLIKDLSLRDLKKQRLLFKRGPTDQKILTFSEALDAIKGEILVNLDFKADSKEAVIQTYQLIKEKGVENQIFFYIYNKYDIIPELRKINPRITIMPRAYSKNDVEKILTFPDIEVLHIDFSFYDDKWTKEVIQKGIRISVNALDEFDQMQINSGSGYNEITKKNINIIETDYPEELLIYLRKRKLHL